MNYLKLGFALIAISIVAFISLLSGGSMVVVGATLLLIVTAVIFGRKWLKKNNHVTEQDKLKFSHSRDRFTQISESFTISGAIIFVAVVAVLLLVYVIILITTEPLQIRPMQFNDDAMIVRDAITLSWSKVWLFLSIAYIVFSFRWYKDQDGKVGYIDTDEIAVRTIFGHPTDVIKSGLPFVPLGLFELRKLTTLVQQKEWPGEPQNVYRGELKERELLPVGMVPPFRVTFRSAITQKQAEDIFGDSGEFEISTAEYTNKESSQQKPAVYRFKASAPKDGLAVRVTAEIVLNIRWRIKQEGTSPINFIENIKTIDEANKQLEDELFSIVQRILPNMSVGQAKQNLSWLNSILMKNALRLTQNWGIEVQRTAIKMIPLHHDLNKAIAASAEAKFKGLAERELLEQVGAGNAKAASDLERGTLEGRAAGLKQLAEELGIEGKEAIAQFVAGQLAAGEGTIVLGTEGAGQLVGIGAALLNKQKESGKEVIND